MIHLKFRPDIAIIPFLNVVKECNGEVELRTPMGDVLNLKSELSRWLLASILQETDYLKDAEIVCKEDDAGQLEMFLKPGQDDE